jgi:putative FmdB family regulatory protein
MIWWQSIKGDINFMPIYEYRAEVPEKGCPRCRKGFEHIQKVCENPLSKCPYCGEKVKKIISWCRAAVIDPSPEYSRTEKKITEYEKEGLYSHAAEMADKCSHELKDGLLEERALENYKKAGYNFDSTTGNDS